MKKFLEKRLKGCNKTNYSDAEKGISVLADFDGITFKISNTDDKNKLLISMAMSCFKDLEKYGASQVLTREYGSYYQSNTETGYDVTLLIDLQTLPADVGTYYC